MVISEKASDCTLPKKIISNMLLNDFFGKTKAMNYWTLSSLAAILLDIFIIQAVLQKIKDTQSALQKLQR